MKKFNFLSVTILSLVLLCSCGGDEESCTPNSFDETVVGTWDSPSLNPSVPAGVVTFNADGTGSTTEDSAFDRGNLDFNWNYEASDSTLFIGSYIYTITELRCDEIDINAVAFDFTIKRQ